MSVDQLGGECDPILTVADIGEIVYSVSGKRLNSSLPAIPCGLIAKSFFNDDYTLYANDQNRTINITQTGIAWSADKQYKFKNIQNPPKNQTWRDIQWLDMENGNYWVPS